MPEALTSLMLVKLVKDIVQNQTATCGRVDMILSTSDYAKLNVAICLNIKPTIAHYHPTYCVLMIPGFTGEVPSDKLGG
jgi:hypothetical protein